jgi:hypothetical protein
MSAHPHQHAAASVQIHSDDLPAVISCGHKRASLLVETDACNFQHPPEAEARFFIASDRYTQPAHIPDDLQNTLGDHANEGPVRYTSVRYGLLPLRPWPDTDAVRMLLLTSVEATTISLLLALVVARLVKGGLFSPGGASWVCCPACPSRSLFF